MKRVWAASRSKNLTTAFFGGKSSQPTTSAADSVRRQAVKKPCHGGEDGVAGNAPAPASEARQAKQRPGSFKPGSPFESIEIGSKSQRTSRHLRENTQKQKPTGRRRRQEPTTTDDCKKLTKTLPLPSSEEFSLRTRRCLVGLQKSLVKLGYNHEMLEVEFEALTPNIHICHLRWTTDNVTAHTTGTGCTKREAEEAASLRLLSKLYTSGVIDSLRRDTTSPLPAYENVLLDAYNLSAHYGCLPRISRSTSTNDSTIKYQCVMRIEEYDLDVKATASTLMSAELYACAKLKKCLDKLEPRDEILPSTQKRRQIGKLNSSNAQAFVDHHNRAHPKSISGVDIAQQGPGEWRATANVGVSRIEPQILATNVSDAMQLGFLAIAIHHLQSSPWIWSEFASSRRNLTGTYRNSPSEPPPFSEQHTIQLQSSLIRARGAGLKETPVSLQIDSRPIPLKPPLFSQQASATEIESRSKALLAHVQSASQRMQSIRGHFAKAKQKLAISRNAEKITKTVRDNAFVVISASLGGGKTSVVPQLLFDEEISYGRVGYFKMLCVLRSRRSAVQAAEYVARHRGEPTGFTIGYETEKTTRLPKSTCGNIIYTSNQFLTQHLHHSGGDILGSFSHIVIDDAECDVHGTEVLLTVLKLALQERRSRGEETCKLVLLHSGTPSYSESLSSYFGFQASPEESRQFAQLDVRDDMTSVPRYYLEDVCDILGNTYESSHLESLHHDARYMELETSFAARNQSAMPSGIGRAITLTKKQDNLLMQGPSIVETDDLRDDKSAMPLRLGALLIAHLVKTSQAGAILVFLPGAISRHKLQEILTKKSPLGVPFADAAMFDLVNLDSYSVRSALVRNPTPASGGRRKILFTSSIVDYAANVTDLKFVVDFGKELRCVKSSIGTRYEVSWTSRHNIEKRMERADASMTGQYIALFTRSRATSLGMDHDSSIYHELSGTSLLVKASRFNGSLLDFFKATPIPPEQEIVEKAALELTELGALAEKDEALTTLGRILSLLNADPSSARTIVMGLIFRCFEPLVVIGAGLRSKQLFARAEGEHKREKIHFANRSDHLAIYTAFDEMRAMRTVQGRNSRLYRARGITLLDNRFLSMESRAKRSAQALIDAGIASPSFQPQYRIGSDDLNVNSTDNRLLTALLLSGSPKNVALRVSRNRYRTAHDDNCLISTASVLQSAKIADPGLIFYSRSGPDTDGKSTVLYDASQVNIMAVLLFGKELQLTSPQTLEVNGWLIFHLPNTRASVLKAIVDFRQGLHNMINHTVNELRTGTTHSGEHVRYLFTETLVKALSWNLGAFEVHARELPKDDSLEASSTEASAAS